ncbi:hypothetical protein PWT90_03524 [Aphanocladium album]|nr:hypothetical protein PWT90_03524 [Aphanocladium album]
MESSMSLMDDTLSKVELLPLPHPVGALLRSFILEALDAEVAAEYVQLRISSIEEAHCLVSDWIFVIESISRNGISPEPPSAQDAHSITERDGHVCCVSGLRGSFFDPLAGRTVPLLAAFFGEAYLEWWLDYIHMPHFASAQENHWLVRRSVATALLAGRYEVNPVLVAGEQPIKLNGTLALLGDHSRAGIAKVDPRFVGTHARFSKSIQLARLARQMAPALLQPDAPSSPASRVSTKTAPKPWLRAFQLTSIITAPLFRIWLLFPQKLRLLAYQGLKHAGKYLYGSEIGTANVHKLPLNEMSALQKLRSSTYLPVPQGLDLVSRVIEDDSGWGDGPVCESFVLISAIPGVPLSQCIDAVSDDDYGRIELQLMDFVSQLRAVTKTVNPGMAICNAAGEACREPRIKDFSPIGPFKDEAAFSQELRFSDEPIRRGHKIVFTHADLNPRNIMVRQVKSADGCGAWEVSGIIDWETAGFYPEYWDCTKSLYEGFRWPKRHNDVMKRVFAAFGDYSEEINVEQRSWESGDGL